jgi:protein-S-isoprenylcysteine O-methyltransferase Ste14
MWGPEGGGYPAAMISPASPTSPPAAPRLMPPAWTLLLAGAAASALLLGGAQVVLRAPVAGAALLALALGLEAWADRLFKRAGTTIKPTLPPSRLVRSGPYRVSRNPMVLGPAALLLGVALLIGSWPFFAAPVAFAWIASSQFIPMEEAALRREFGVEFEEYARRVRCWL